MKLLPLLWFILFLVLSYERSSAKKMHRGTKKPCTKHKHHHPSARPTAHPSEHPVTKHRKPSHKPKTPCTRHKHRVTTQPLYTTPSKPLTEARPVTACQERPCVVSKWSEWSICSSLCGNNGVKHRTRKVITEPTCGGTCAYPLHEVKPCNRMCPNGGTPLDDHCRCQDGYSGKCCEKVNGQWSPWGKWSKCSTSCGNGKRQRMRTCDNPSPANGGSGCQGDSHESVECNEKECPVDGGWSGWGPWSPCSTTCGQGQKFRLRQCSNPFPRYGGKLCLGLMLLTAQCQLKECKMPGGNAGSGAVGKRSMIKRRLLNYLDNGIVNDFEDIVQRNVDKLSTPEERTSVSGPWTSWSSCSVTCGTGQRFRSRACQDLANPCVGVPMEIQTCKVGECTPLAE